MLSCMLQRLLSTGPFDMENQKASKMKSYRDLMWELAGMECK